jgi:hypothetical protein
VVQPRPEWTAQERVAHHSSNRPHPKKGTTMKIAGKTSDSEWKSLKGRLSSNPTPRLWVSAFRRFYRARINTRYLDPIKSINKHDRYLGEGFAVVAVFCTLVEYLESCEQGHNFRAIKKGQVLSPNEYSQFQASNYFRSFLRNRTPFNVLVPSALVDSFYCDVRCGLLHEARTRGGWVISAKPSSGKLVTQTGATITLFRNELIPALEKYLADYRTRLLTDRNTQAAFIRKWDHLCVP